MDQLEQSRVQVHGSNLQVFIQTKNSEFQQPCYSFFFFLVIPLIHVFSDQENERNTKLHILELSWSIIFQNMRNVVSC